MSSGLRVRRRPKRFATVVVLSALAVCPPLVHSLDEPGQGIDLKTLEGFHRLTGLVDRSGWDEEYPLIERAIDNIWQRNGWTAEADRFARNSAREIASIPPWEPMKRLNAFHERIAKRYGLSKEQASRFQGTVLREAGKFLMRNTDVILEQMREGMGVRSQGKPFTAEQVAGWAKQSQPLLADLRDSVDRLAKELEPMLEPNQREILKRDLDSYRKRSRFMDAMTARWAAGKWQPVDWGMQDDPIQRLGSTGDKGVSASAVTQPSNSQPNDRPLRIPRWVPHDPDTWFAYVLKFQQDFSLDAAQVNTAESIHAELIARAKSYSETHTETLERVPVRERPTHEAYDPIRTLFRELQERLDAIPTSSQRDRNKENVETLKR